MTSLKDELAAIYREHSKLTSELVVDVARDSRHPLHNRFEWDDSVAGEKYRQVQASELIRSVKVKFAPTPEGDERPAVNAFHSVPTPAGRTYVPVEQVAEDPFQRQLVLQAAEREWRDLRRRYSHLQEFIAMIQRDVA